MKSIIAFSVALLAATAAAAPYTPPTQYTTVQISNDQSGKNDDRNVTVGGGSIAINQLFAGSRIDIGGVFDATSYELVDNFQNVECDLINNGIDFETDTDQTFREIDPKPVDLVNAFISCEYVPIN